MKTRCFMVYLWLTSYLQLTESKGGGNKVKVKMTVTGSGTGIVESPYSLKCLYDQGVQEASIVWKRDSNLIYVDHGTIWKKHGITGASGPVTQGKKSHMINIQHLHLPDAGVYKCIVRTIQDEEISAEKTVVVKPLTHVVKVNDQYSIRCTEPEFDNPTSKIDVVWQKGASKVIAVNGKIVVDELFFRLESSGDLFIRNMTENLVDEYSCYVNGEKLHSEFISTPIEEKPHRSRSLLAGTNGIVFGVFLGVLIVSTLVAIKVVENRIYN